MSNKQIWLMPVMDMTVILDAASLNPSEGITIKYSKELIVDAQKYYRYVFINPNNEEITVRYSKELIEDGQKESKCDV